MHQQTLAVIFVIGTFLSMAVATTQHCHLSGTLRMTISEIKLDANEGTQFSIPAVVQEGGKYTISFTTHYNGSWTLMGKTLEGLWKPIFSPIKFENGKPYVFDKTF
ncbi:hypothetical protein Ddc_12555 [Ditylenchus destructor]|nr:hypothetical protein Ddc_12555 [Ditylenchus destructor]